MIKVKKIPKNILVLNIASMSNIRDNFFEKTWKRINTVPTKKPKTSIEKIPIIDEITKNQKENPPAVAAALNLDEDNSIFKSDKLMPLVHFVPMQLFLSKQSVK